MNNVPMTKQQTCSKVKVCDFVDTPIAISDTQGNALSLALLLLFLQALFRIFYKAFRLDHTP